jgi:pimeloyl-ACP methyl ester carboxylesterase
MRTKSMLSALIALSLFGGCVANAATQKASKKGSGAKTAPKKLPKAQPKTPTAPVATEALPPVPSPVSSVPSQPTTSVPDLAATPLVWQDCTDGLGKCTDISVPLDYKQPGGRQITLQLVKIPAKGKSIGSMMVNPGGPGASGRTFARQLINYPLPDEVFDRFDIIGFDPRGVETTIPIHCASNEEYDRFFAADPTPDDEGEVKALVDVSKKFADECLARNKDVLPFVSTADVVQDMDRIRRALREDRISYLGFSYGTYLGARYAQTFPRHVRAFVLDAVLDPTADSDERVRRQAVGFEEQLNRFLESCKSRCAFAKAGEPAGQAFDRVMLQIDQKSIPVGSRSLGQGEAWLGVLVAMYSSAGWPRLESALRDANNGKGAALLSLSDLYSRRRDDGSYGNLTDANTAINCLDIPADRTIAHYTALADEFAKVAPRFGAFAAYSSILCAFWPLPSTGSLGPAVGYPDAPVLLIGTTGDPATPYLWAESVHKQMAGSTLLTYDGIGHSALPNGSACINAAVGGFLVGLKPPADGSRCK